ncbi:hypothetical protein Glove_168g215 [Diversispora epigaea]|uniref:Uncharacterized protein n=1 Tax=Diversispora epigaea TaxID=1348612 RepID=A0A397IPW5_9GLOM|nr:hypothetical protein Glove_168g215 [Diversispora epigaea]
MILKQLLLQHLIIIITTQQSYHLKKRSSKTWRWTVTNNLGLLVTVTHESNTYENELMLSASVNNNN